MKSKHVKRNNLILVPKGGGLQSTETTVEVESERDYDEVCFEFCDVMLELLQHSRTAKEGLNTSTFNHLVKKMPGQFTQLYFGIGEARYHAQSKDEDEEPPF